MAERVAYLQAVVGADISSFRYSMGKVRDEIGILGRTVNQVSETARLATYAISAPLAIMGTGFAKASVDFDASMRNINSIAGMTESELSSLGQQIREFGMETRAGVVASADALYAVYSAGVSNQAEAMRIMETSVRTAEAGLADITITTEALTGSILAYSNANITAEQASNALTRMVQVGVGSMQEFAMASGYVNSSGAALGVTIEELYAHMAFLTQRNFSASRAGTSLNNVLSKLMKPTFAMSRALDQLGVSGGKELIDKFGGLQGALSALASTTDGSVEAMNQLFNDVRGARAVLTFTNDVEGLNSALNEFYTDLDSATMSAWEQQNLSAQASIDKMTSSFESMSIVLGDRVMVLIMPFVQLLDELFTSISSLDDGTLNLVVTFGMLAVGLPPLVWLLTSMLTPIGLIAGAFASLALAVATNFGGIRDTIARVVADVRPHLDGLITSFQNIADAVFGGQAETGGFTSPTLDELMPSGGVSVSPSQMSFTVGNQSLFDYWQSELSDRISWADLWSQVSDQATGIGETITFDLGGVASNFSGGLMGAIDKQFGLSPLLGGQGANVQMGEARAEMNLASQFNQSQKQESVFSKLIGALQAELPNILESLRNLFSQLVSWFLSDGIPMLVQAVTDIGIAIATAFVNMLQNLPNLIRDAFQLVSLLFDSIVSPLREGASDGTVFGGIGQMLIDALVSDVPNAIGYALGRIAVLITNGLITLMRVLVDVGKRVFSGEGGEGLLTGILEPFSALGGGFVSGITEGAQMQGLQDNLDGLGMDIMTIPFIAEITGFFDPTADKSLVGMAGRAIEMVINLFIAGATSIRNFFHDAFASIINTFILGIQDAINHVIGALNGLITEFNKLFEMTGQRIELIGEVNFSGSLAQTTRQVAQQQAMTSPSYAQFPAQSNIAGMQAQASAFGGAFGGFGGFGVQGRAIGGMVNQGQPYMVGELGAELFIPRQSGRIVPNNRLGGGNTNQTNNITINGVQDVDALLSELKRRGIKL